MHPQRMRAKRPILNAMKNPRGPYAIWPFAPKAIDPFASACPTTAPYPCTGFPGECSAYPSDHPLHGIDCKSYTTPQPGYLPGSTISQQYVRQSNPADCSSANTPASQCKWLCYPMPTPTDPHRNECVRVPIEAQLGGAFFTSTPSGSQFQHAFRATPPRQGIFRRAMNRIAGR